jgi:DNA-binding transcriptional regulator YdaS (Cro superfamily)
MAMSIDDVRAKLKALCAEAGSEKAWAEAHGLSQPYVNDTIRGKREPGASLLKAMGLEKVVQYRPLRRSR